MSQGFLRHPASLTQLGKAAAESAQGRWTARHGARVCRKLVVWPMKPYIMKYSFMIQPRGCITLDSMAWGVADGSGAVVRGILAAALCTACGYTVETVPETRAPENVDGVAPAIVSRTPPPPGSQELGRIKARKCFYGSVAACHELLGGEAAARFDANYVQVVDDGSRITWCAWSAPYCSGVAYINPALPSHGRAAGRSVTTPTERTCTKDTDCSGDLVCTSGRCAR
jgi:hypothetical protein